MTTDPVDLTARLVRCPSVTPEEGGALVLLDTLLSQAGFHTVRVDRGGIANLYARWGTGKNGRSFGFNGHTDVVPIGDPADWTVDPFGAELIDGYLYGRGATDMKSGVAAFAAAAVDFVANTPPDGSIILAITGDEEADATDGTAALLDWMDDNAERMDICIVGEPTCPTTMGEMMKIGRRGSLTAFLTVTGVQGHVAYPHRANNPLHALTRLLDRLIAEPLDEGSAHFDPTTLQITTIDTGNPASNVIPATVRATVNIRFSDVQTSDSIRAVIDTHATAIATETGATIDTRFKITGESFLTPPGDLSEMVANAVEAETGIRPVPSTSGGTSDARFVKNHCPVVEFGLVGERMHGIDERVKVEDIHTLKRIYTRMLHDFFA